jgi:hypothetical protein
VDENGRDQIVSGGEGKNVSVEVLHLPPGHFCGYRLTCGSKGIGGRPDLEPGRYKLYGVFKNGYAKLPGPGLAGPSVYIDTRRRTEWRRIERENEKLGENSLWVGQVFSESTIIEVVEQ